MISEIGTFHDRPTHSRVDSPLTHYQYGMPEDAETRFEPASISYGSYTMYGFPTDDLAFHVELDFEPNTIPRGTLIPYHAKRFGSTSHIAPSIPVVEATSYIPPRSRVSDPIRIPNPRQVTIGGSTYIITQIPSSSVPSSSNVHPPPYSRGPSSRYMATSQVHTAVTRPIVSQVHIPPAASGGYHSRLYWSSCYV